MLIALGSQVPLLGVGEGARGGSRAILKSPHGTIRRLDVIHLNLLEFGVVMFSVLLCYVFRIIQSCASRHWLMVNWPRGHEGGQKEAMLVGNEVEDACLHCEISESWVEG